MRLTNAKHHNATHGKGRDGVLPIKLLNPGASNVIFIGSEANLMSGRILTSCWGLLTIHTKTPRHLLVVLASRTVSLSYRNAQKDGGSLSMKRNMIKKKSFKANAPSFH